MQHAPPEQHSATREVALAVPMNAVAARINNRYFIWISSFAVQVRFIRPFGRTGANQAIALRGGGTGGRAGRLRATTEAGDSVSTSCGENMPPAGYGEDMSGNEQAGQQTEF